MSKDAADADTYALKSKALAEIPAPEVAYRPPSPKSYRPRIGMIGTGGISGSHLDAYRSAGWEVAAMWNRTRSKAEEKAAEFCPEARIFDDWQALLDDPSIDVIDATLHPEHRLPIMKASLKAGKHVLSQKPFVTNLDDGEELAKLADDHGVRIAVNQNGRWAPHNAYMREAVRNDLIGEVISVHVGVHWDHGWTANTPFDEIADLILFDFGIHWFDFMASVTSGRVESVFATAARSKSQSNKAPLLAQAVVRLEGGQASLVFDGGVPHGARCLTFVGGTEGTLVSDGPDVGTQSVRIMTAQGVGEPALEGNWFNDGFRGAMGELLCAIEENREPSNGARENLQSLALTFAAVHSRQTGKEVAIGASRRLE